MEGGFHGSILLGCVGCFQNVPGGRGVVRAPAGKFWKRPRILRGFGRSTARIPRSRAGYAGKFLERRDRELPARLEVQCRELDIEVVSLEDARYPRLLKEIADPPVALYLKGRLPATDQCIAIVGPREADGYGLRAAKMFARDLAEVGLTIVSGGARGIDTTAHEAALDAGGATIAVLGCGVDVVYPSANRELFGKISRSGALLSEYPPGTPPYSFHFPQRNRLISGLCRGVLLTEASRRSGSLITASCALDQNRDVFCVPGNIFTQACRGANDLIAHARALLVQEPADILRELYPDWQGKKNRPCFPIPATRLRRPIRRRNGKFSVS